MKYAVLITAVSLIIFSAGAYGADFNGDGADDPAIFRPATGLWAVRGVTWIYFGSAGDVPVPVDADGDGTDDIGIFRPATGLWAVRELTRIYYGGEGDVTLGEGGCSPYAVRYDYVVRPHDGDDLVRALESTDYDSVFIPGGTYGVSETINVGHVTMITGDGKSTVIEFSGNYGLSLEADYCLVEKVRLQNGFNTLFVNAEHVTVRDCIVGNSNGCAFSYTEDAIFISFINCTAQEPLIAGFYSNDLAMLKTSRLVNCAVIDSGFGGFAYCCNLSNCYVSGGSIGFSSCHNLSACRVSGFDQYGYFRCERISSCEAQGDGTADLGFNECWYVSSSWATGCVDDWYGNFYVDRDSCNEMPPP